MRVVILVPRRAGVRDRDELWRFTRAWWESDHPEWPIVEGVHEASEGPFNRSLAINRAAEAAGAWDVAVVIDSDVLVDPAAVRAAVLLAAARPVVVCAGHRQVHVDSAGTRRILGGWRGDWERSAESVYVEHWSSVIVVGRPLWNLVGGYDPLFVGWGHEDDAFRYACETMGGSPLVKMTATIWHLYHDKARTEPALRQANRHRADAYRSALNDVAAMRKLLDRAESGAPELAPSRIPRILHRTIPAGVDARAEHYWSLWQALHPGWDFLTHQDPLDPDAYPVMGDLFSRAANGAQLAGLVRLDVLARFGGVYVDSDVEPYRSLEPLLAARGFAAWEDRNCVPDAVLGAEPNHPAVLAMCELARARILAGDDAWMTGPGVTTALLPGRDDFLVLPPGTFYPYHYKQLHLAERDHAGEQPWAFAAHHWAGSWLTPEQKARNARAVPQRSAGGNRSRV